MLPKLLFVNNGFPTKENPSYTTYVATMEQCLVQAGAEVTRLVIMYNRRITPMYQMCKYIRYWTKLLFKRLASYDAIYINHLPYAWTLLLNPGLYKKKVFVHWHGTELVGHSPFLSFSHGIIRSRLNQIKQFGHIVPSVYFKHKLMEVFDIPESHIQVSPSGGVDVDRFRKNDKIEGQFVIGFASALTTGKGADVLLGVMQSWQQIEAETEREISFKVINYGEEASHYIECFLQTGARLEIVDKMPKSQMPDYYNSLLLLLLSSKRVGESLGLVVLEAMSCGVPVVTHDICAFPEFVISGVSGEMSIYDDDLQVRTRLTTEAIIKLIKQYDHYHPRDVVLERYSQESVVEFYCQLLNSSYTHEPGESRSNK